MSLPCGVHSAVSQYLVWVPPVFSEEAALGQSFWRNWPFIGNYFYYFFRIKVNFRFATLWVWQIVFAPQSHKEDFTETLWQIEFLLRILDAAAPWAVLIPRRDLIAAIPFPFIYLLCNKCLAEKICILRFSWKSSELCSLPSCLLSSGKNCLYHLWSPGLLFFSWSWFLFFWGQYHIWKT